MFLGLLSLAFFSLSACATEPTKDGKTHGSISIYELRHHGSAESGNILVHGVFQLSIESLMVKDEKCAGNVIGLEIPEEIETKPSVSKLYSTLIKNPTPISDRAVYATVLVSPQYDATNKHILRLMLVDVVSQSVSSEAAWEKQSDSSSETC